MKDQLPDSQGSKDRKMASDGSIASNRGTVEALAQAGWSVAGLFGLGLHPAAVDPHLAVDLTGSAIPLEAHGDYHVNSHSDSHEDSHNDTHGDGGGHADAHSDYHNDRHDDTHTDSND